VIVYVGWENPGRFVASGLFDFALFHDLHLFDGCVRLI
jgi:hypothetical protein